MRFGILLSAIQCGRLQQSSLCGAIAGVRRARDPIEHMRTLILEHEFAEPGDLKRMEKEIKKVRLTQAPELSMQLRSSEGVAHWLPIGA